MFKIISLYLRVLYDPHGLLVTVLWLNVQPIWYRCIGMWLNHKRRTNFVLLSNLWWQNGMARFGPKVVHICHKWDKSIQYKINKSVLKNSRLKKIVFLSHLRPIWPTLGPNLVTLRKNVTNAWLFVFKCSIFKMAARTNPVRCRVTWQYDWADLMKDLFLP